MKALYNSLVALASMGGLGIILSVGLVIAAKKFSVEVDERIEEIEIALPGVNCGACGFAGCRSLAEAIAEGKAPINGCPVGGIAVAEKIAEIMGADSGNAPERKVAQVLCRGGCAEAAQRAEYDGPNDCRIMNTTQGGDKGCTYGCLGGGTCVEVCPFNAMYMDENGLPVVIEEKCTGCGKCVEACPRDIIILTGEEYGVHIRCRSLAPGKEVRQVCKVGCIACRRCEKECPCDAITVTNNLAEIDYDKCTVCRRCVAVCPVHTIEEQDGKPEIKAKKAG
ncbi:MAG: RnfABCDGE type electron transport complex subunit B [Firmicutes bacterium]|nr:RnfABCDGE type electron transport complex subunit B [Bacillota bacterium]NLL87545.1 RnfABCDGE type electron transport complex subunit B [Bacillota bacterium]HKM17854.1 RnfABCDGE type electron transport complex subunit B [Limnochordia bacterium]